MRFTPWGSHQRNVIELILCGLAAFVWLCLMHEHDVVERVFVATLMLAFMLLFACLTRRFWFALVATLGMFALVWISGKLKFNYLEVPVIAPDIYYFINADTVKVIGRYPLLAAGSLATVLGIPLALWLAWRSDWTRLFERFPARRRRLLQAGGALFALAVLALMLWNQGPYWQVYGKPMWVAINDESFITDFVISFYDTQIEIPQPKEALDPSIQWPAPAAVNSEPARMRPDVIAVLEESTFDPTMLAVCKGVPLCKRRMFQPDKRTVAHGFMGAHTFGGGTWTAEFSLITGLNHAVFGNAGLYAPYNMAPRMHSTIARQFKAAGYRVLGLYPTSSDFINGRNAYRAYGFDQLFDGVDLGLEWHSSDEQVFDLFWKLYREEKDTHPDQPLFFFVLTIHQHGPHMTAYKEMPAPYDKPLFARQLDDWQTLNLTNYLERNAASDQALTKLEGYVLDRPQPTVLLHFGDHQPSFDGAMNNLPKVLPKNWGPNDQWATYYMLKANFPLARKYDYPIIDLAYLGGLLLDVAGVPKDEYFTANTMLRERCAGRYLECENSRIMPSYYDYVFNQLKVLEE